MGSGRNDKRRKEEKRRARKADPQLQYYVVALLDILGFRHALMGMASPPNLHDDHPQKQTVIDNATRAIRIRRGLVGLLGSHMAALRGEIQTTPNESVSPEIQALTAAWRDFRIGAALFSDSIILYVPLHASEGHGLPMRAIASMITACATSMTLQLARGTPDFKETLPLRGAIDVDLGMEVHDRPIPGISTNEPQIYSAALARVACLEKETDYPRLIVTDGFREAIAWFANRAPVDAFTSASQAISRRIESLLFKDTYDGADVWAVDYIGQSFHALFGSSEHQRFVSNAWKFVTTAHRHWQDQNDEKLVKKYAYLEAYFRSRLPLWGLSSDAT